MLRHVDGIDGWRDVSTMCNLFDMSFPHRSVTLCGNMFDQWASTGEGYVFITWKGDHPPRHVHVYRDGRLIVKWDLDNHKPMTGAATRRILNLIAELEAEGLL